MQYYYKKNKFFIRFNKNLYRFINVENVVKSLEDGIAPKIFTAVFSYTNLPENFIVCLIQFEILRKTVPFNSKQNPCWLCGVAPGMKRSEFLKKIFFYCFNVTKLLKWSSWSILCQKKKLTKKYKLKIVIIK